MEYNKPDTKKTKREDNSAIKGGACSASGIKVELVIAIKKRDTRKTDTKV